MDHCLLSHSCNAHRLSTIPTVLKMENVINYLLMIVVGFAYYPIKNYEGGHKLQSLTVGVHLFYERMDQLPCKLLLAHSGNRILSTVSL